MNKGKFLSILLLLILLNTGTGTSAVAQEPSPHQAAVKSTTPTEGVLKNIAYAALTAQNQVLVSGNIQEVAENINSTYWEAIREGLKETQQHRAYLATHHITYTGFQTDLTVTGIQIAENQATMQATEHTILELVVADGNDPLAPKATEYIQDHLFIFVFKKGQWQLSADQKINVAGPVPLEHGYIPPVKDVTPSSPITTPQSEVQAAPAAVLNRQKIVNYAVTYWEDYNPSCRSFDLDCTNFVSQAVRAGGWTYQTGHYKSKDTWWYSQFNQTWTWVNAEYWWWFIDGRRGDIAAYISGLEPGDILQVDFDRDNYVDHSMVVTAKDSSGTIYLTYHTDDTLNKPFWDIYNQHPNAWYYGWRLRATIY